MHYIWQNVTNARRFLYFQECTCMRPYPELKISPPTARLSMTPWHEPTNRALDTIVIVFHEQIGPMIRRVVLMLFTPRLNWAVQNAEILCLRLLQSSAMQEKALGVRNISSEAYYVEKKHGRWGKKGRAILQQMNHTRCQDNLIEALKTKRRCLNIRPD